jgi:hypothetical protein
MKPPHNADHALILLRVPRLVRRTGRYYWLILIALALHIFASIRMTMWNDHTSDLIYYLDMIPMGAGYASFLSCSIIVSSKILVTLSNKLMSLIDRL